MPYKKNSNNQTLEPVDSFVHRAAAVVAPYAYDAVGRWEALANNALIASSFFLGGVFGSKRILKKNKKLAQAADALDAMV